MKQYGLQGVWRGKGKITTNSRNDQQRADDLVNRNFNAYRPKQLWVADFTYIKTTSGWVYTAFIIDVFARAIVGWKVSNRMNTDMVIAALNQAIADRNNPKDVIYHSDRGVQYLSIRYTDKMTDSGVIASVGTTGDSYDNAMAETVNGLYKSEVIEYLKEQWHGVNDVELAILEWVDWFNKTPLESAITVKHTKNFFWNKAATPINFKPNDRLSTTSGPGLWEAKYFSCTFFNFCTVFKAISKRVFPSPKSRRCF